MMETKISRDGPKTIKVCDGCRYLKRADFNFAIPPTQFNECMYDSFGRFIGMGSEIVETPNWCPFLNEKKITINIDYNKIA